MRPAVRGLQGHTEAEWQLSGPSSQSTYRPGDGGWPASVARPAQRGRPEQPSCSKGRATAGAGRAASSVANQMEVSHTTARDNRDQSRPPCLKHAQSCRPSSAKTRDANKPESELQNNNGQVPVGSVQGVQGNGAASQSSHQAAGTPAFEPRQRTSTPPIGQRQGQAEGQSATNQKRRLTGNWSESEVQYFLSQAGSSLQGPAAQIRAVLPPALYDGAPLTAAAAWA